MTAQEIVGVRNFFDLLSDWSREESSIAKQEHRAENAIPMSDTRFDGNKIYEFGTARPAVYDIRGNYVHKANTASQAVYEIRGDFIYRANRASQPEFEIKGNRIHKANTARQAIYEIR